MWKTAKKRMPFKAVSVGAVSESRAGVSFMDLLPDCTLYTAPGNPVASGLTRGRDMG